MDRTTKMVVLSIVGITAAVVLWGSVLSKFVSLSGSVYDPKILIWAIFGFLVLMLVFSYADKQKDGD